ncbi:unnamed protein product [Effrenium voratum]|nr:unnamed protein product [Effrenium voratum]
MALQPRAYQLECVQELRKGNTIVSLPTGGGKTLIAVLALDEFLRNTARAMFIVPTRVLVEQQAKYCREKCRARHRVAELAGGEMDSWGQERWSECLRDNDILVGTPEVFRRALVEGGFISALDFALLIFDECHNATGNSPMAAIMKDAIWKVSGQPGCPRILGLTASFVNGSLKNLEQKRQQIEALLQSKIFCPEVPSHLAAGGSEDSSKFRYVDFPEDVPASACQAAEEALANLLKDFEATVGLPVKDAGKLLKRSSHVLEELGVEAFQFALQHCIAPQLEAHAEQLLQLGTEETRKIAQALQQQLPQLKTRLQSFAAAVCVDAQVKQAPKVSGKAVTLLGLLARLFSDHKEPGYRGIIFTTQDQSLQLSAAELEERRLNGTKAKPGVYPFYPPGGSEVNFFNGLQIVYEYCAKTMGQSINPEDFFTYKEEVVCIFPKQVRKTLVEVRYPSPQGLRTVSEADIEHHWRGTRLDDVLDAERCKNQNGEDKNKRRALFVVAIQMHRQGLLDQNNQPCALALAENRKACPAMSLKPGVRVKSTYGATAAAPPAPAEAASTASTTSSSSAPPAATASISVSNAKGVLNEWAVKQFRQPAEQLISYDTSPQESGFVTVVTVANQKFTGQAQPKKKDAEQAAAEVALQKLLPTATSAPVPAASLAAPTGVASAPNPKSALNEWALKHWRRPAEELLSYSTVPAPGGFVSTLQVAATGQRFTGQEGRGAIGSGGRSQGSGVRRSPEQSEDASVTVSLCGLLHEPRVRRAAVLAVPRVAGKGCQAAVEVLIPPLEDESVDVRVAAVKSLLLVAEKGDPRAIAALTVRLEDQEVSKERGHQGGQGLEAVGDLAGGAGAHCQEPQVPGPIHPRWRARPSLSPERCLRTQRFCVLRRRRSSRRLSPLKPRSPRMPSSSSAPASRWAQRCRGHVAHAWPAAPRTGFPVLSRRDAPSTTFPKLPESVHPGVVSGQALRDLLDHAKENGYAIPAVNCVSSSSINACIEAARKMDAPIMIQFSSGGSQFYAGKGLDNTEFHAAIAGAVSGAYHVRAVAEQYGVPVILHTDHCAKNLLPWFDGLLEADERYFEKHGEPLFSSHMLDLSEESRWRRTSSCA